MKLKLEMHDTITILCVSEDIQAQHCAILKAGLNKILQSGKNIVLLDLSEVTPAPTGAALGELILLRNLTNESDAMLIIASPVDGLGHAPTKDLALKQLETPIFKLLATEAKLQSKIKRLEVLKNEISTKLSASNANVSALLETRKENSVLKKSIETLEAQVERMWKFRISRNNKDGKPIRIGKESALQKTLVTVLEREGIVQVKQ